MRERRASDSQVSKKKSQAGLSRRGVLLPAWSRVYSTPSEDARIRDIHPTFSGAKQFGDYPLLGE